MQVLKLFLLLLILSLTGCTYNSSDREYCLTLKDLEEGAVVELKMQVEVLSESSDSVDQSPKNDVTPELSVPMSLVN